MKFSSGLWPAGFVLLIFGVQDVSGAMGFSAFILAIISGFLLGTFSLTSFILFLMAVTPPEGRALHKRGIRTIRSVSLNTTDLPLLLPTVKNESISLHQNRRLDGRFLQNLIAQDPLNCLPQLLCSAASSPSTKAEDIINDYQFLLKEVLQQASDKADGKESSGYHNIYTKLESYNDDVQEEDEEKESDEKESDEELDKIFELMSLKEKSELEDRMYSELVEDDPDNLGYVMAEMNEKRKRNKFRKQTTPTVKPSWTYDEDLMKTVQDPDIKKIFERFKPRLARNLDIFADKLEANKDKVQARNPRIEKLAFFSRKQRELKQALSIEEKFRIASDVGQKYRSGRQCRRLFNTCPFQPNTLSRLVNNLRRVLTGAPTPSNKQTGSLANNGQGSNSIVSTATKPSTNVQVVVNLGSELGGLVGKQTTPVTPTPMYNYQTAVPVYQQPPLLHTSVSVPNAFTKPATNQLPTPFPLVNYQNFKNNIVHPSLTSVSSNMHLFHAQPSPSPSPMTYHMPISQIFPLLYTTTRTTTVAPTTTTTKPTTIRTVKPSPISPTEGDNFITKPFFENFLKIFNMTTPEPKLTFHTGEPININKLPPKNESPKPKPTSGENFGYSFSRPVMSSTTTEKGYLLPVGFDVDPGTRTISSSSSSTEFVTSTLSEGIQEDGTWMPLEHIFTHPSEGSGSEFVLHRQPPKNNTATFTHMNKGSNGAGATFHFQHQSSAEKYRIPVTVALAPVSAAPAPITMAPAPVTVAPAPVPQKITMSPQRIAAENFLKQIMSGLQPVLQSSTIFTSTTTTTKPKRFTEYTNKPKPYFHVAPGDYLTELETAFKLAEKPEKKTDEIKVNSRFPSTTEAEQRESDDLLSFIRNMEKEKVLLREGTEKPPKSNLQVHTVPVADDDHDPDMKEIDEVIKLLDEQSKEDSEEEVEPIVSKGRPGKPKEIKIKSNMKQSTILPLPLPTKTTTTTTTTSKAPGIVSDMNEVINLLNNEEKKSKPQLSRSQKTKGNRRNSKITRKRKRKPKPSSEESSEEDYEDNELPPSFISRYRQLQLRRPLIAVPYRRQDSDEYNNPPPPQSPVQALTSGVYSFLFNGISNKNNNVAKKPHLQRYLPLQQKQRPYRNQYSDEDEPPYTIQRPHIKQSGVPNEYRIYNNIPGIRKEHIRQTISFQGGNFRPYKR